eukprot:GGOE01030661.1.p1 GENE.GGOE01030661.1~~GGOE01030661.1.p1  ORF type:complete len:107 (+),score=0.48 GGOE01030661.1:788-1108(+)
MEREKGRQCVQHVHQLGPILQPPHLKTRGFHLQRPILGPHSSGLVDNLQWAVLAMLYVPTACYTVLCAMILAIHSMPDWEWSADKGAAAQDMGSIGLGSTRPLGNS